MDFSIIKVNCQSECLKLKTTIEEKYVKEYYCLECH